MALVDFFAAGVGRIHRRSDSQRTGFGFGTDGRRAAARTLGGRSGRVLAGRYRDVVLPNPTPRLRFRTMAEADLADIATLAIAASRSAEDWIEWNLNNYKQHGFGLWVIETHDGEFVGDCGLTMQEVEGNWQVEAGWHVRSPLRRQGYAAEAAEAVRMAAQESGIKHLIAIIRPDNVASQRVAAKIGLVLEREVHKNGSPALVFGTDLQPSQSEQ